MNFCTKILIYLESILSKHSRKMFDVKFNKSSVLKTVLIKSLYLHFKKRTVDILYTTKTSQLKKNILKIQEETKK